MTGKVDVTVIIKLNVVCGTMIVTLGCMVYTPSGHVPVSVGCCVLFTFVLSCVVFCLDVFRHMLCIVYPRVFQFLCVVCLRVCQVLCVVKLCFVTCCVVFGCRV